MQTPPFHVVVRTPENQPTKQGTPVACCSPTLETYQYSRGKDRSSEKPQKHGYIISVGASSARQSGESGGPPFVRFLFNPWICDVISV